MNALYLNLDKISHYLSTYTYKWVPFWINFKIIMTNLIPQIYSRDQHPISRQNISKNALDVLYKLHKEGYRACLVGGGVRDLLLNSVPKDFDIATDAHPEQIKRLFRNCRLIGRRFRLAHILFGRDIIEVATFRTQANFDDQDEAPSPQAHKVSDTGFLLRDNVYGNIDDDAIRRDFTINALYYDIANFSIIDYCDGLKDLQHGIIRLIGDPITRFKEDPVRILRAIRFEAKLDFKIEENTKAAIQETSHFLQTVSAARMFDEIIKLLLSGEGVKTYKLLQYYQIFSQIFPQTQRAIIETNNHQKHASFIEIALRNSDIRLKDNLGVSPFFLYAALLWEPYLSEYNDILADGFDNNLAAQKAAHIVISRQLQYTAIPKRFSIPMQETWFLQNRLERMHPKSIKGILEHAQFRAAFDFLQLRAKFSNDTHLQQCVDFWQHTQVNPPINGLKHPKQAQFSPIRKR